MQTHGVVDQVLRFEVDEDPGVPLGFRDRLARENGWSRRYADRVYDEYRRFLVLAATGDRPVTPSDEVDQAWHLHLTYTRSYWDHLCGEVLGHPLHHGPTRGTVEDGAHYREQYAATLATYAEVFGAAPPADVWPPVAERFRDPARWRRIDTRAHLVVRRAPIVATAGGAVGVLALTGASDGESVAVAALVLLVILGVMVAVIALLVRSARGRRRRRGGGDGAAGGVFVWGGDTGSHDAGGYDGGGHDSSGGCGGGGGDSGGGGGGGCGGGGCGGGGG